MRRATGRFTYNLRNNLQVLWHTNKRLLILLGLFCLGGVVLGIIVSFNPLISHLWISNQLLDGNVLNVASPNRGLFTFLIVRLLDIMFGLVLVLLFNMTKWTMLLTFPYIGFRAFWAVINLFWIIDLFGFFHGFLFLVTYIIFFTILLALFACACVFALKRGKIARLYGLRMGFRWMEIKGAVMMLLVSVAVIALLEWLIYFLILSRMVFILV